MFVEVRVELGPVSRLQVAEGAATRVPRGVTRHVQGEQVLPAKQGSRVWRVSAKWLYHVRLQLQPMCLIPFCIGSTCGSAEVIWNSMQS